MSDKAAPARDTKAEHPAQPSAPDNTSRVLFDDTQSGKTIGRFTPTEAKACKTNAPEGTVPTLMPGKESKGCEFKGMRDMPRGLSHLDLPNIYNQAAPSTVRFDSTMSNPKDKNPKHAQDGPSGSGAIIGKDTEKGECLVATANHVVSSDKNVKIDNIRGITADGKTYPAEVRAADPNVILPLLPSKQELTPIKSANHSPPCRMYTRKQATVKQLPPSALLQAQELFMPLRANQKAFAR
jgi:S1-C subfamily serine protease